MRARRHLFRWVSGATVRSAGLVAGGFGVAPVASAAASLTVATASRTAAATPSAAPWYHAAALETSTSSRFRQLVEPRRLTSSGRRAPRCDA